MIEAGVSRTYEEFAQGWRVLLASFLGMSVCISSLVFYSAGIWVRPWQEEFGWSRAEIAAGTTFGALALVLAAPFAGRLLDRFSMRTVAVLSLLLLALGLFGISRMTGSLSLFFALSAFCGLVGAASSPLAFTRAVNLFFDQHRGLALGIALTSTGVAGILIPQLLTPYVATQGWRAGYLLLVAAILVFAPFVYFLLSERSGKKMVAAARNGENSMLPGVTLKAATRRLEFWMVGTLFFLAAVAVGGLIPAFVPLLQDAGLGAAEAGQFAAVIGGSVVAGRLLTGFLIDRLFAGYVAAAAFVSVALGLLALALGGADFAIVGAAALGFSMGCEVDMIGYLSARYFGLRHYGVIYSIQYGLFQIGCGIGPILVGYMWDISGSYDIALKIAVAQLLAAAVLAVALPKFATLDPPSRDKR